MPKPFNVFISYSRKDMALCQELVKHLSLLKHEGVISTWTDSEIGPGTEWKAQILEKMNNAQIILLLISVDFLDSPFCRSVEMAEALERHKANIARVIPIILRRVYWKVTPFAKLQALPRSSKGRPLPVMSWRKRDDAFTNIVEGIHVIAEDLEQKESTGETVAQNQSLPHTSTDPTLPKVHHNLPPQRGEFLGREKEVERVLASLRSPWPLISIEGLGGVGKTTLAIEAARSCLPGSHVLLNPPFEYVIWISASYQPGQKFWLNEVLDTTARILDYPFIMKLSEEQIEQKKDAVSQLLRTYRTLLIIDNFETIEDRALESWIQSIPEPSKVLITSRTSQLHPVRSITLKGLEDPAALELISSFAQSSELQSLELASSDTLLPLVQVTGGNPKAIEMALGFIRYGKLSLSKVIEYFPVAGKPVSKVFDYLFARFWSVRTQNTEQVLLVIPFFVDYASQEALQATAGLSKDDLEDAVEELVGLKMLDIKDASVLVNQQYSVHPLVHAFASAKLEERQELKEQARERWITYYLALAARGLGGESKERYWNALPPYNHELIDPEWPNLQEVLRWADQQGEDRILLELMVLLPPYMYGRMLFPARVDYSRKAAEAASRLGQKADAALLLIDACGWILLEEGRFADAIEEITRGLRIAESPDTSSAEATNLIALANAWLARAFLEQGRLTEASALMDKVKPLECKPVIQYRVYFVAGNIEHKKGNIEAAIKFYENACQVGVRYRGELVDARLGDAYLACGNLTKAEDCFNKVLAKDPDFGTHEIPHAKYGLAGVALAKGEKDKARALAQEALDDLKRTVTFHWLLNKIHNFLQKLNDIS